MSDEGDEGDEPAPPPVASWLLEHADEPEPPVEPPTFEALPFPRRRWRRPSPQRPLPGPPAAVLVVPVPMTPGARLGSAVVELVLFVACLGVFWVVVVGRAVGQARRRRAGC